MTHFFPRLRWRIILILAALRQGWPISRRGRAWYAGATGMEGAKLRLYCPRVEYGKPSSGEHIVSGNHIFAGLCRESNQPYTLNGDGYAAADGRWAE